MRASVELLLRCSSRAGFVPTGRETPAWNVVFAHLDEFVGQGWPALALLTLWVGQLFVVGACTVHSSRFSSFPGLSAHQMPVPLPAPSCDNPQCLQMLPPVPWGRIPLVNSYWSSDQTGLNLGLSQGEPRGVLMALVSYEDRLQAVALFLNIGAANFSEWAASPVWFPD